MYIEGYVGHELARIRELQFLGDADSWRKTHGTNYHTTGHLGVRRRLGRWITHTGARIADVDVEPCLTPDEEPFPARG
jgi:hypothetical protein